MASPKALREWCRLTCASYPDVDIKNMSTSFRDGLAFCAIIHKHRPDLIDFTSLSKDNVYQNNKLAFEVAETKLGIRALLDPNDMGSSKVPDRLSIMTYLCQYYNFFNRKPYAGLASSRSSHGTVLNNLPKDKTADLKPCKSLTEVCEEDRLSNTRPRAVCNLCFKPVHLIQRHLIDRKVYHRSCFRNFDLLRVGPNISFKLLIFLWMDRQSPSIPHYAKKTESQDRLVCKAPETEGKEEQRSREVNDSENRDNTVEVKTSEAPGLPPHSAERKAVGGAGRAVPAPILADGKTQQEVTETKEPSELSSTCIRVTKGSTRPVPAPRRKLDSPVAPVPAPRAKTFQTMASSSAAGNPLNQNSSHISSTTTGSPKVKTNHPWLAIVHPGPWTRLPPAPAPVPFPRSKSVSNLPGSWYSPKVPPANPFGEDVDEDTQEEDTKPEPAEKPVDGASRSSDAENTAINSTPDVNVKPPHEPDPPKTPDFKEAAGVAASVPAEGVDHTLPRSLSVPATTFAQHDLTEANESDQVTPSQSKQACKENPFDRSPAIPKSKTSQVLASRRTPAPGHGFPLIKRKVQTDQNVSTEDLQVEIRDLDKHLEALEQRGVELERNLRDCKNEKKEEQMLMEWFSVIHERDVLLHRDTELVYLTKQQELEERQADVEYELRCLLNRPESDWSQDDRAREKQLMDELVSIIEQRNQIISSLDQDRQREREEDMLFVAMMKDKGFQKDGLKELKNFDDGDFDDAEEDEGLDDLENVEDEDQENVQILPAGEGQQANQKRITTPYMTKYERARVLGTRALQIAMCAPVMVELEGETDPLQIAMKELKSRKIPIIIRRYLPDGSYEDWGCDELIITD
ncbi:hypothetical protein L3Q82_014439 [Scortum barcoo]|uniref:Uncharacterized protein n=1 Tax=Scortum barcoo TaxID=214431 RepID=A0ACB8VX97_9TELE|nr:hypothetical protein L3Q82_014439 [Scortum barcoo]